MKSKESKVKALINPVLAGKNIIEHLRITRDMEQQAWRYFHYRSKCWKAIREHIATAKDCVLIERAGVVAIHSAGYGISFRRAHNYAADFDGTPSKEFCLKFRVSYWERPDIPDNRDTDDHEYSLNVPIELELEYTEAKFKAWIASKRRERSAENQKKDVETLRKLVPAHPRLVKHLLRRIIKAA